MEAKGVYCRLHVRVHAQTKIGQVVAIIGSSFSLGGLDKQKLIHLVTTPQSHPVWCTLDPIIVPQGKCIQYSYCLIEGGKLKWTEGTDLSHSFIAKDLDIFREDTFNLESLEGVSTENTESNLLDQLNNLAKDTATSPQNLFFVSYELPIVITDSDDQNNPFVVTFINSIITKSENFVCNSTNTKWVGTVPFDFVALSTVETEYLLNLLEAMGCIPIFLDEDKQALFRECCDKVLTPLFLEEKATNELSNQVDVSSDVETVFANTIFENVRAGDVIWVHDYHLMLLPKLLRQLPFSSKSTSSSSSTTIATENIDTKIVYFFESSFPSRENFLSLLNATELLESLFHSDVVGFQSSEQARNFVDSCESALGVRSKLVSEGSWCLALPQDNRALTVCVIEVGGEENLNGEVKEVVKEVVSEVVKEGVEKKKGPGRPRKQGNVELVIASSDFIVQWYPLFATHKDKSSSARQMLINRFGECVITKFSNEFRKFSGAHSGIEMITFGTAVSVQRSHPLALFDSSSGFFRGWDDMNGSLHCNGKGTAFLEPCPICSGVKGLLAVKCEGMFPFGCSPVVLSAVDRVLRCLLTPTMSSDVRPAQSAGLVRAAATAHNSSIFTGEDEDEDDDVNLMGSFAHSRDKRRLPPQKLPTKKNKVSVMSSWASDDEDDESGSLKAITTSPDASPGYDVSPPASPAYLNGSPVQQSSFDGQLGESESEIATEMMSVQGDCEDMSAELSSLSMQNQCDDEDEDEETVHVRGRGGNKLLIKSAQTTPVKPAESNTTFTPRSVLKKTSGFFTPSAAALSTPYTGDSVNSNISRLSDSATPTEVANFKVLQSAQKARSVHALVATPGGTRLPVTPSKAASVSMSARKVRKHAEVDQMESTRSVMGRLKQDLFREMEQVWYHASDSTEPRLQQQDMECEDLSVQECIDLSENLIDSLEELIGDSLLVKVKDVSHEEQRKCLLAVVIEFEQIMHYLAIGLVAESRPRDWELFGGRQGSHDPLAVIDDLLQRLTVLVQKTDVDGLMTTFIALSERFLLPMLAIFEERGFAVPVASRGATPRKQTEISWDSAYLSPQASVLGDFQQQQQQAHDDVVVHDRSEAQRRMSLRIRQAVDTVPSVVQELTMARCALDECGVVRLQSECENMLRTSFVHIDAAIKEELKQSGLVEWSVVVRKLIELFGMVPLSQREAFHHAHGLFLATGARRQGGAEACCVEALSNPLITACHNAVLAWCDARFDRADTLFVEMQETCQTACDTVVDAFATQRNLGREGDYGAVSLVLMELMPICAEFLFEETYIKILKLRHHQNGQSSGDQVDEVSGEHDLSKALYDVEVLVSEVEGEDYSTVIGYIAELTEELATNPRFSVSLSEEFHARAWMLVDASVLASECAVEADRRQRLTHNQ